MVANIKEALIYRHRVDFDDGAILEVVVWWLLEPVPGCSHAFKTRSIRWDGNQRAIKAGKVVETLLAPPRIMAGQDEQR